MVIRGDMLTDRPGEGGPEFGGWRIALNRFLWRAFIFATGPFVVWLEKVLPGRGYGARLASVGARLMNACMGVRVDVRGLERIERGRAYVFAPNHRSPMDIAALMVALPSARFAGKIELWSDPTLGAPIRALDMIPIDRANPGAAKDALARAAARLGRSVSLIMFPEGTMAPAGRMGEFKSGAFVFAIGSGLPVVPVALHNTRGVMRDDERILIPGGRVVVEILEPVPTQGLTHDDRGELKDRVRMTLVEALRPIDGGVAERRDLGSFRGHAFGVRPH
jgi:1-acyl-sn-glycerol-3-phosphate acyltransferase